MKRRDRIAKQSKHTPHNEPHHNTYYQPVGQPPKKQKPRRIFRTFLLLIVLAGALFIGAMYLMAQRADIDELKSIEQKSSYVSAAQMPDYTKGAFIAVEDRRFYKH